MTLGSCFLSLIHVDDVLYTVPVVPHDSNNFVLDPEMSQRLNLGDFDEANNLSMSCNTKVDKFLVGGDVNGNVKFRRGDLHGMSPLSHSDPEGLHYGYNQDKPGPWKNVALSHPVSILSRQATWHKLLSTNPPSPSPTIPNIYDKVLPQETDLLVIDQITSTV